MCSITVWNGLRGLNFATTSIIWSTINTHETSTSIAMAVYICTKSVLHGPMEAVVIHWPISCIALLQTDDICVKKNNMFVRGICVGMKIHFVVINGNHTAAFKFSTATECVFLHTPPLAYIPEYKIYKFL